MTSIVFVLMSLHWATLFSKNPHVWHVFLWAWFIQKNNALLGSPARCFASYEHVQMLVCLTSRLFKYPPNRERAYTLMIQWRSQWILTWSPECRGRINSKSFRGYPLYNSCRESSGVLKYLNNYNLIIKQRMVEYDGNKFNLTLLILKINPLLYFLIWAIHLYQ